ncbi:hypothetical protein AB8810_12640 [Xanthomonas sp. NCPPB 3005]|uniref:hypothetical protein n=1 Tax=Xanthomonas sp. NCPPB 3005 TaxID=3240913 RepID=UPI003519C65E
MDKKLLLTPSTAVEREITLADGQKHTTWFKPVTGGEFFRFQRDTRSEDENVRIFAMQRLIACSLCEDARGRPTLTNDEARALSIDAINVLFPHVIAVSRTVEEEKKDSPSEGPRGSDTPLG